MTRRSINFSSNQQSVQRDKIALGLLLLALIALLGGVYASEVQREQASAKQQLLQDKLVEAKNNKPATLEKKLQNYWTESKTNWAGLFSTLEEVKNPDITLLSIDPQLSEKLVLISGLAKNQETLNLYLTKLESSTVLKQVELQRYRRTTNSPNGLEFFVVAQWIAHD
ncbi:MAG: PilN domain-containing protein [Limnobacter sp.]|uniref:PilN domain-containing protein n=1 Tax=Limnobacter sp. TaxID=2003368 RepID=UPI0040377C62